MKKYFWVCLAILFCLIFTSSPLSAKVKKYVDEGGQVWYVNKADSVPVQYLNQVGESPQETSLGVALNQIRPPVGQSLRSEHDRAETMRDQPIPEPAVSVSESSVEDKDTSLIEHLQEILKDPGSIKEPSNRIYVIILFVGLLILLRLVYSLFKLFWPRSREKEDD